MQLGEEVYWKNSFLGGMDIVSTLLVVSLDRSDTLTL